MPITRINSPNAKLFGNANFSENLNVSLQCAYGSELINMLLLSNCEDHMAKYVDRIF